MYFRPESDRHYVLCCVHWVNVLAYILHGCYAQDLTDIIVYDCYVMVRVGVVFGNKYITCIFLFIQARERSGEHILKLLHF